MTFGDLRYELTKWAPGVDSDLIDGFINERYRAIWERRNWLGREKDAVLQTTAPYSTGTVEATAGSTSLTGTGTTWTTAMTGRRIRIAGRSEWYTFTFATVTTGTLDRAFEGDTDTEHGYEIYQAVYDLPTDLATIIELKAIGPPGDLALFTQEELDRAAPHRPARGTPEIYAYAPAGVDGSGNTLYKVELYPSPDESIGLPYKYRTRFTPFSSTETVLPDWISPQAVKDGVRADIRGLQKDLAGAQFYEAKFDRAIADMQRDENKRRPGQALRLAPAHRRGAYTMDRSPGGNFQLP
jgi:hypothetical protein